MLLFSFRISKTKEYFAMKIEMTDGQKQVTDNISPELDSLSSACI